MVKCYHCGQEITGELFYCSDCGQNYCSLHEAPVDHECNIVKESQHLQQFHPSTSIHAEAPQVSPIPQESHYQQQLTPGVMRGTTDGTYTWYRQEAQVPENAFDPDSGIQFKGILLSHKSELLHFLIGVSLIFLIGILNFYPDLINSEYTWGIFMLAGFYATAFLFHELGHRQVAVHFKLQTKFRLLTYGMILTVFSIFLGLVSLTSKGLTLPTLALPGAVVVLGLKKIDRSTGLCKAAGPSVNLIYGTILFMVSIVIPTKLFPLNLFLGFAANINYMLGMFNMIPIGILDGQNIWKWNKWVYLILAISLLALLVISYMFIYAPVDSNLYY